MVIVSALVACILAVCFVAFVFLYTPMMDWLIQVVKVSPSFLFSFIIAIMLLIGCLVLGFIFIRRQSSFWRWLVLFIFILFFGCTSGLYGSFYVLSKEEKNGCITKDCAWFD